MVRLLPLLLGGCVLIGDSAHQQRIADAAVPDDTDPVIEESAPAILEATYRFRFNDAANYAGVHLLFRATDADGDLAGGVVQVEGENPIPLSTGQQREGDWWSVPLDHLAPMACEPPERTVVFTVQDVAGNVSSEYSVPIAWSTFLHDESNTPFQDANEPVVTGVGFSELPAAVCGYKGVENGFADVYDDVQVLPGADRRIQAVANFLPGSDDLSFGLITLDYNAGDTLDQQGASTSGTGVQLDVLTPSNPIPHYFTVWGGNVAGGEFRDGDWVVYIQPALPPVVTP